MNWWCRFLKQRRQSDRVKLQVVFVLLGLFFLGDFLYRCTGVWQFMQTPVEYIVTAAGTVEETQISELREQEHVKTVSRQQMQTVTFSGKNKTVTADCLMLSREYLENAYGIQSGSGANVFYLNRTAWEGLAEAEEDGGEGQKERQKMGEERSVSYSISDGLSEKNVSTKSASSENPGGQMGKARAVLVETLPDSKAYVFLAGNTASLSGGNEVRVQFFGQDLDGMNQKHLTRLGFEVANISDIELGNLKMEMQFMRMQYDALLVGIMFFAAFRILKR